MSKTRLKNVSRNFPSFRSDVKTLKKNKVKKKGPQNLRSKHFKNTYQTKINKIYIIFSKFLCFMQWKKLFINSLFLGYQSKCSLPVYKCILLTYITEAL